MSPICSFYVLFKTQGLANEALLVLISALSNFYSPGTTRECCTLILTFTMEMVWKRPSTPQTGSWLCPSINTESTSLELETSGWVSGVACIVRNRNEGKIARVSVCAVGQTLLVGCHWYFSLSHPNVKILERSVSLSWAHCLSFYLGHRSWKRQILRCQLPPAWWHWWWIIWANLQACEYDTANIWHFQPTSSDFCHSLRALHHKSWNCWWNIKLLRSNQRCLVHQLQHNFFLKYIKP